MAEQVVIRVGTFAQRLSEVTAPVSAPVQDALMDLLNTEAVRVGQSVRDQTRGELVSAVVAESQARERLESVRAAVSPLAERLTGSARGVVGLVTVGLLMMICAAASFASDFVVSRAVIPWLLSVSPSSLLGMALSIAPAVSGLVLDRVMFALFDVDDAWESLRAFSSGLERRLRHAVRILFFAVVGGLTLFSVWLLADARAIASLVKMSETLTMTPLQQQAVDRALQVLTVALTINGGLFYLFGVQELRKAGALWRARRALARLRADEESAAAAHLDADRARRRLEQEWNEIEPHASAAAASHRADGRLQLELAIARPIPLRQAREVVSGRLNVQVPSVVSAA